MQGQTTSVEEERGRVSGGIISTSRNGISKVWLIEMRWMQAGLAVGLVTVAITARLIAGPRYDGLLTFAAATAGVAVALLSIRFLFRSPAVRDPLSASPISSGAAQANKLLQDKLAQEKLAQDRLAQKLLDAAADGICGVDSHGVVTFANPAAARLLAAEAIPLTGKPVHELLHGSAPPTRQCESDCPLRYSTESHKLAVGLAVSCEDTLFRFDGSAFPAEYAVTPIYDQGSFSGSVLSFRDISQRYALDRLKDEFISTVSHELRTPLTSIRGALGLLSSGMLGEVNDKAANLLRIALTNSDRLVRLINDILDLERIQSGKERPTFRPVRLADIVSQAMDGMAPVAEAAGVQLVHENTQLEKTQLGATQIQITADPDRLLQVLTNLLSNAIKFSPRGSTVSVQLHLGGSGVTLSVIDQGRGIPADKLDAVFGRFQQVDASDSRQKGGSGLGLAICRTIVLQHSGRIWAERNPTRGSTFRVFLPFQPVPPSLLEETLPLESDARNPALSPADSPDSTGLDSTALPAPACPPADSLMY